MPTGVARCSLPTNCRWRQSAFLPSCLSGGRRSSAFVRTSSRGSVPLGRESRLAVNDRGSGIALAPIDRFVIPSVVGQGASNRARLRSRLRIGPQVSLVPEVVGNSAGWHEGCCSEVLQRCLEVSHGCPRLRSASLQQTSTYLNATLRGLHESMRTLDQSRPSCKPLASTPLRGLRPVRKQAAARNGKSLFH
jgi:hypothetical protein